MACYRCAEPFKFFKKEVGCGNCGFSFCSKCCNNKIPVPRKDNKNLHVCAKCYELLTKKPNESELLNINQQKISSLRDQSPPKALLKLAESNISKANPPIDPNKQIVDRLEKLYDNDQKLNSIPTENEIEKRLRQLQGLNLSTQKLSNLPTKDKVVTSDDLIKKMSDEVIIDKSLEDYNRTELEKLENRLKNLKSTNTQVVANDKDTSNLTIAPPKIDPHDELMKKMLNDAENEQKSKKQDDDNWCIICNNDADLRCIDCEEDPYCKRCFNADFFNPIRLASNFIIMKIIFLIFIQVVFIILNFN